MTQQLAPIVGPEAQKSILTISKASVKKQLLSAEFSEQLDTESNAREFTMQGKDLVHPDLESAIKLLIPHFCLLTEQLEEEANYFPEEGAKELSAQFDNYGVTGLVMGARNGVTLVGFRKLENGKVLNMTAQYVDFGEQSEEDEFDGVWKYAHAQRLEMEVQQVIHEVEAALRGKRSDAGRQMDIFDQPREIEMGEATGPQPEPQKQAATRSKKKLAAGIDAPKESAVKVPQKSKAKKKDQPAESTPQQTGTDNEQPEAVAHSSEV